MISDVDRTRVFPLVHIGTTTANSLKGSPVECYLDSRSPINPLQESPHTQKI